MMRTYGTFGVGVLLWVCACAAPDTTAREGGTEVRDSTPVAEAISLLGQPLYAPSMPEERRAELEANLAQAEAAWEHAPEDADSIIWLGRRLAYLARYRDAIEIFTRGILMHPADARMYRHRGHRYITVREFDNAIRDLERAAELVRGQPDEIEPDGAPNAYGIPTSTLQGNIWYHLALAHYLKHDFTSALPAWLEARSLATNDDMLVATSDWLWMTYRRLGRAADAAAVLEPIRADMRILENDAYHRRLLMYRGEIPPDSLLDVETDDAVQIATYGYGVGNWYLVNGDEARAEAAFKKVVDSANWAAFGYIAAEAELGAARAGGRPLP